MCHSHESTSPCFFVPYDCRLFKMGRENDKKAQILLWNNHHNRPQSHFRQQKGLSSPQKT